MSVDVAIIVPTLGTRARLLEECLMSIRRSGPAHVVLTAPDGFDPTVLLRHGLIDQFVTDPGRGLAAAINNAAQHLPSDIQYFNWLGDDDQLTVGSLAESRLVLRTLCADFVWGSCEYINEDGVPIGVNRSGQWALKLMRCGPDLVPQPGALFKRDLFEQVGGLDEQYGLAFDYDLFMKFSRVGTCLFSNRVVARYRWHSATLSAGSRKVSVREASRVRQAHLSPWVRPFSFMWEPLIGLATYLAGSLVSRRVGSLPSR